MRYLLAGAFLLSVSTSAAFADDWRKDNAESEKSQRAVDQGAKSRKAKTDAANARYRSSTSKRGAGYVPKSSDPDASRRAARAREGARRRAAVKASRQRDYDASMNRVQNRINAQRARREARRREQREKAEAFARLPWEEQQRIRCTKGRWQGCSMLARSLYKDGRSEEASKWQSRGCRRFKDYYAQRAAKLRKRNASFSREEATKRNRDRVQACGTLPESVLARSTEVGEGLCLRRASSATCRSHEKALVGAGRIAEARRWRDDYCKRRKDKYARLMRTKRKRRSDGSVERSLAGSIQRDCSPRVIDAPAKAKALSRTQKEVASRGPRSTTREVGSGRVPKVTQRVGSMPAPWHRFGSRRERPEEFHRWAKGECQDEYGPGCEAHLAALELGSPASRIASKRSAAKTLASSLCKRGVVGACRVSKRLGGAAQGKFWRLCMAKKNTWACSQVRDAETRKSRSERDIGLLVRADNAVCDQMREKKAAAKAAGKSFSPTISCRHLARSLALTR